jgi:MFS transporter, PPP family, 3-phenylpropionic acid transporter
MSLPPDRKKIYAYGLIYFGLFGAFAIIAPFLQLFLRDMNFSPSQIGIMQGSFEVAGIIGPMLLGRIGDKTGRYKLLIIMSMSLAIVFHSLLILPMPFYLALLIIFFLGFFYKNGIPLTDTLASHGLPRFQSNYGKVRIVGSLGYVIISFTLSILGLIDGSSPRSILFWFIILVGFQIMTLFFVPPPSYSEEERLKATGHLTPFFWLVIAIVFFNRISMSSYYSFFFLFIKQTWAIEKIGAVSALAAFAEIPIIILTSRMIRRFGYVNLFFLALASVSLRMLDYAFARSFLLVLAGQLLHCLTFGLMHALTIAFIQEKTKPANRGVAMAIYMSIGIGLAGFIGSTAGGYIVESQGYRQLFFYYGLLPLGGLVPLSILKRKMGAEDK